MYIGCLDVIVRSDLDGENIIEFVTTDVSRPNGFALDRAGEFIHYQENALLFYYSELRCYVCTRTIVMHSNAYSPTYVNICPFSLAGKLYWSDVSRNSIDVIDTDSSNRVTLYIQLWLGVKSLYLDVEHQRLYVADLSSG